MVERHAYLRDGAAIYERSFATIRAEADLSRFTAEEAEVAVPHVVGDHEHDVRHGSPSATTRKPPFPVELSAELPMRAWMR